VQKNKKCSKPVSRILYEVVLSLKKLLCKIIVKPPRVCHLSWPTVTGKFVAVYPPASDEPSYNAGIHDLSTHQAYNLLYHDRSGELLPRLFTLTTQRMAVIFCYATLSSRIASR